MRTIIFGFFALALVMATGCYKQDFVNPSVKAASEPAADMWQPHFLFGLISGADINLKEICPNGVAKVHEKLTFSNGFVGFLTLNIYSPNRVQVYCADGTAQQLYLPSTSTELANAQ